MSSSTMFNSQFKDSQTDENNNPKTKDCLLVKPSRELNFAHSKSRYTADLQLLNKKDEPVIYKIRTTAAKSYIVLPTIGVIPPRGVASIKIHMPTKEHTKERLTDKFLIQAFTYNGGDLGDDTRVMTQVFDQSYKTISPKELQNTKLRVYFESHTVIEEEMTEETASVRQQSPSTAMTRDVPESSSAFFASKPESHPSSAIKFSEQIKTVLSPEPEPMTRVENDDLFTRVLKDDRSDTLSEISNRNFRNLTPEPYVYHVYPDKSRVSEPEVLQMSQREEAVKVSRNLKSEFEKDAPKRNSLSNITNSLPRSFNSFNDNDVSIHTDISDVKSTLSLSEQLASYKQKLDLLERKYNEQNVQMARIMQEREAYQKEALNLRRGSASLSTTADETKLQPNNKTQMDVWHLIVLCIVCMILGSIFR